MLGIDEAALWCCYVERSEKATVRLNSRVDEAFHNGVDVGPGIGKVGVDGTLGLG